MLEKKLISGFLLSALSSSALASEQYVAETMNYFFNQGIFAKEEVNIHVIGNGELSMRADVFLDVRDIPSLSRSVVINFPFDPTDPITQAFTGGELLHSANGSEGESYLVNTVGGVDYYRLEPSNVSELETELRTILRTVPTENNSFSRIKAMWK